ncbi:MAG: N-acetyltransferase [Gemmatales bacterium]|nr:N-acetyltransferase [Gemmatales bacterium]MCS7161585.1 N-acetyltransferase [Gemmatales bacterium]MDW8176788.1 N-acetyltransferase [Gemmatales bacterium]MDW8223257.1 N-acetyltransferase [Gemmatales bacterium]
MSANTDQRVVIRAARVGDVPALHALIRTHAERGKMILRTLDELYANIREFYVAENSMGQIVGCAAAHVFWNDLAELKCLAVHDDWQGRGIGRALCEACLSDLARLGVKQVFTLTNVPEFFEKIGYRRVDKNSLPRFIWGECIRCPTFPICNEEALVRHVPPE